MVSVWGLTDRGIVRRENQDSCAYEIIEDGDLAWGVVCDGMGGAKAGDIASKMAVETFCAHLEQLRDLEGPPPAADLRRKKRWQQRCWGRKYMEIITGCGEGVVYR